MGTNVLNIHTEMIELRLETINVNIAILQIAFAISCLVWQKQF